MFEFYKAYAAMSNDNAPQEVLELMGRIARRLAEQSFTARHLSFKAGEKTGFAEVVAQAASGKTEVYLPWKGFNNAESKFTVGRFLSPEAASLVKQFMPTFEGLKPAVQKIIGCNAHVVMGQDLRSPVRFLIVWSEDGLEDAKNRTAKSGYMGTPVSIASSLRIPVFNLKNPDAVERLWKFLETQ